MKTRNVLSFFLTLASLAILVACAPKVEPEESCNFVQNSQLQRVSWPHGAISIGIHQNVLQLYPDAKEALEKEAVQKWVMATGKQVFRPIQVVDDSTAGGVDVLVIYSHKWDQSKKSEQAKTEINYKGTDIYSAKIYLNGQNNQFYTGVVDQPGKVHLESVLLHEIGHALGLKHITGEYSVMNTHLSTGTKRVELADTDINSIQCEY